MAVQQLQCTVSDGEARFRTRNYHNDVTKVSLTNATARHLLFRVRACRSAALQLEARVGGKSYSKHVIEIGANDNTATTLARPTSRKPLVSKVRATLSVVFAVAEVQ